MQCGFSNCIVPVLLHWKAIRNVGVGGIHPDPAESGTIITKRGGGRENNINLPTCNCNSTQQTELQNIGWWYTIWLSQRQKMVKLNWSNFPTINFFYIYKSNSDILLLFFSEEFCVWERERQSKWMCMCVLWTLYCAGSQMGKADAHSNHSSRRWCLYWWESKLLELMSPIFKLANMELYLQKTKDSEQFTG